jgi:hypothetical protein
MGLMMGLDYHMSYRKNSKRENSWKRWLKEHQAFLTEECGLPLAIVADREEWLHFLDHGFSRSVSCPRLDDRQWSLYLEFHREHEDSESAGISEGMLPILLRARENEARAVEGGGAK